MSKNIKDLLGESAKDLLTEESLTVISEAFDTAVNEKVEQRVQLALEAKLAEVDEDHAQKLQKLLEAIDTDHTKKLQVVVERIDADHTKKLQQVVARYKGMLNESATKFQGKLVDEISNYLELYLDKTVPTAQLNEAVNNIQAKKMLDEIKKIVAVDQDYINENVREALRDGKSMIDNLRSELNEVIKENVRTSTELRAAKAELILEKRTMGLPEEKKNYITKVLGDKAPDYIEENYDFVVEMFERDEDTARDVLREQAQQKAVSRGAEVQTTLQEESAHKVPNTDLPSVNRYLSEMQKFDRPSSK